MSLNRTLIFLILFIFLSINVWGETQESPYIPQIVKISDEQDLDSLSNEGVEILRRRGDIILCLFPNPLTRSKVAYKPQRKLSPTLDIAKSYYDANSIQNGTATGIPYTGKGVVVGICDIGIDPLHPTFLDAEGRSRIKRVVQYVESEGIRLQIEGDDNFRKWKTDTPDKYHATHVCGILAGNGAGTSYSGIATDAEIVVTVSTLTEVGLLAGVEDIIDYAKEVGKPAVINISVGCYTGPHDGSSLFSQYLDMCADDAFIVLSSGNEGLRTNTLITDFTPQQNSVSFKLGNNFWDQFSMRGVTDIWSGTDAPLDIAFGLYDSNEKKIVRWFDSFTSASGESRLYNWDGGDAEQGEIPFKGEMYVEGNVDPENGRHLTKLCYDYTASEISDRGNWARYELAISVTGEPGNDVEVYADGIYTRLTGLAGNLAPSSVRSVSDLACGRKVICVGMYGNRDSVPMSAPLGFDDDNIYYKDSGFKAGVTAGYSSYGTLRDGRILPHTCAPGGKLVSAASRPFLELYPYHPHLRLFDTQWVDEGGTSMSSPYVAGYIATWLEAVPSLTIDDVMDIISSTNHLDIPDADDPHNGNGYFDPVAGLKMALKVGGVGSIGNPDEILSPDDHVEVYDLSGVKRYSGMASGLDVLEKGFYIIRGPNGIIKRVFP